MRPLRLIQLTLGMVLTIAFVGCTPAVETNQVPGSGRGDNDSNGSGSGSGSNGGGNTKEENVNGTKEGEDFFNGKVVAAFRDASANCLSCHDAPRNVLDVPDASDERIYDYGKMFGLLKIGDFSNDNEFINPMLGKTDHPGPQICRNEESPLCALAIEWYGIEFAGAGASSLGLITDIKVQGVNRHVIEGYAKDIDNAAEKLTVKAYIDGDKDNGTLIGESIADKFQSSDIGNHAFQVEVPAKQCRQQTESQIYVYAVKGGEEEMLRWFTLCILLTRQANAFPGLGT